MKLYSAASLHDCAPEWSERSREHDAKSNPPKKHNSRRDRIKSDNLSVDDSGDLAIEVIRDSEASETRPASSSSSVRFCSRSEAICAEMLLRYVPHFELREGVTFQVAIGRDAQGNMLAVDFLVDGVLFEYHPVRLFKNRRRCGDFGSKRDYRAYAHIAHSLKGEQRDFFQAAMSARLARNYYTKRREMLDQHPMYRRMELIVASSPEEFYFLVLKRFGRNVPRSVERFKAIFDELRESLGSE